MASSARRWTIAAAVLVLLLVVGGAGFVALSPTEPTVVEDQSASPSDGPTSRVRQAPADESSDEAAGVSREPDGETSPPDPEELDPAKLDERLVREGRRPVVPVEVEHGAAWPPEAPTVGRRAPGRPHRAGKRAWVRTSGSGGPDDGDAHEPGTLLVRVFAAETGEPLPGASVEVRTGPVQTHGERRRIEVPRIDSGRVFARLDDGPLDVRVRHTGRVPFHELGLTAAPGRDLVLDVQLERGRILEGSLVNEHGVFAEGVRVRVWPAAIWWDAWPQKEAPFTLLEGESDRWGRVVIDALPRLTDLVVDWGGGEWVLQRSAVDVGPQTEPVYSEGITGRATRVGGRVMDELGRAVEGAEVFLAEERPIDRSWSPTLAPIGDVGQFNVHATTRLLKWAEEDRRVEWTGQRVVTGSDGRYEFDGVIPGLDAWLYARHAESGASVVSELTPSSTSEQGHHLRLRGRSSVWFAVKDVGGEPLRGARVTLPWLDPIPRARERSKGRYGPLSLPVGWAVVSVTHAEQAPLLFAGRIEAEDVQVFVCRMWRPNSIAGRVVTVQGDPVPGARVVTRDRSARTDAGGRFRLDGLHRGEYALHVTARDFAPQTTRVEAPTDAIDVELSPVHRLRVRLRLPPDAPVPAWVRWGVDPYDSSDSGFVKNSIDWDDGVLEIDRVPDLYPHVAVRVPGYELVEFQHESGADLVAEGTQEVELIPERSLYGRVVDEFGRPVSGAVVRLSRSTGSGFLHSMFSGAAVRTDATGRFLVSLPTRDGEPWHSHLTIECPGFLEHELAIREREDVDPRSIAPDLDRDVKLVRGVWIHGRAIRADAKPVADADVRWPTGRTRTDADGRFSAFVGPLPVVFIVTGPNEDEPELTAVWKAHAPTPEGRWDEIVLEER